MSLSPWLSLPKLSLSAASTRHAKNGFVRSFQWICAFAGGVSLMCAVAANAQGSCSVSGSTVTCTNSSTFDTPDENPQTGFFPSNAPIKASIYPTYMTVSGASGTVSNVVVELEGIDSNPECAESPITHAEGCDYNSLTYAEFVLVAPNGTSKLLFMGGPGDGFEQLAGLNMIVSDKNPNTNAANPIPPNLFVNCASLCPLPTTGTEYYAPFSDSTSEDNGWELGDTFTSPPGNFVNANLPTSDGNATFASVFDGVTTNGNWDLYLVDWFGDPVTVHGWNLTLTFNATAEPTTTSISTNTNPAIAGDTVTY